MPRSQSPLNLFLTILLYAGLIFIIYTNHERIFASTTNLYEIITQGKPCSKPLTYKLGTVDRRFGLSNQQLLTYVDEASKIWDKSAGKKLFQYSEKGKITINLMYDYRQEATDEMAVIDYKISDKRSDYENQKKVYNSLLSTYQTEKRQFDNIKSQYDLARANYEARLSYLNQKSGATKQEAAELETMRQNVNSLADKLNIIQTKLNKEVVELNRMVNIINSLAHNLNIDVKDYNTIGASTGEEFEEGEYIEKDNKKYINIYQFDSNNRLTRVLAHEFGHALGLDHVTDPESLMYKINSSSSLKPSNDDVRELMNVCGL